MCCVSFIMVTVLYIIASDKQYDGFVRLIIDVLFILAMAMLGTFASVIFLVATNEANHNVDVRMVEAPAIKVPSIVGISLIRHSNVIPKQHVMAHDFGDDDIITARISIREASSESPSSSDTIAPSSSSSMILPGSPDQATG